MTNIKKEAYYSLSEAVELTPLKSRETLARYIRRYQGASWSINKVWIKKREEGKGRTSRRYVVSGEWVKEFNKRYKANKLNEHSIFSVDEVRYTLNDIIDYCNKNKIETVKQFIDKKRNEEQTGLPINGNK